VNVLNLNNIRILREKNNSVRKWHLKRGYRERGEIKQTLSVKTDYGVVENVPVINWRELLPYWQLICRAIFEVLVENNFNPYAATLKRRDGFVASSFYWYRSLGNPVEFPLSEAKYFIYKLKEKPYFLDSIKEFNKRTQTNWLEEKNIATLGGYLNSFFFTLKPVLRTETIGTKSYMKPVITKREP